MLLLMLLMFDSLAVVGYPDLPHDMAVDRIYYGYSHVHPERWPSGLWL
jgi:hypothetical protein